jgi:hypothetical protein
MLESVTVWFRQLAEKVFRRRDARPSKPLRRIPETPAPRNLAATAPDRPLVLNPASFWNVVGAILPCILLVGGLVGLGIANLSEVTKAPLFVWVLYAMMVLSVLALLAYILVFGGRSVAVLEDGLHIELWISSLFGFNRTERVRWHEIQRAGYTVTHIPGGTMETLHLRTLRGRLVFRTLCFDVLELRRLKAILVEKIGSEKFGDIRARTRSPSPHPRN